jgi:5,10-methenyltetrahydrofolate synthetase
VDKKAFRAKLKKQPLTSEECAEDGQMAEGAMAFFEPYHTVAAFMPMANEPQIQPLIEMMVKKRKRLLLPRVLDKERIAFFEVKDLSGLEKSAYGILEPRSELPAYKEKIDLMLIPLLALATNGTRLGHGGGYYDRFLAAQPCTTVAIINKKRLFLRLPKEKHDVKVNYYIVDGEIYPCGGK